MFLVKFWGGPRDGEEARMADPMVEIGDYRLYMSDQERKVLVYRYGY
jgi:truncated hemoglobin YjbI